MSVEPVCHYNLHGLALDSWISEIPDDVYEMCPCGCENKFKYICKDIKIEEHEKRYIERYLCKN